MIRPASRNPWTFIPTLYFAEGLPYVLVNTVSVILYKRLGLENASITFWTGLIGFPWVFKMLWGPLVDTTSSKRSWVIGTQLAMALCLAAVALTVHVPIFYISLIFFLVSAFVSATHDIAADGFYMLALSQSDQSLFVGIRATFYRLAMIFGTGFLVWLAGSLESGTGNIPLSWSLTFGLAAAMFAGIVLFHHFVLPVPATDARAGKPAGAVDNAFIDVFKSYFAQPKIGAVVAFILFYRLGEALVLKLNSPFFLDSRDAGGLGLTTAEVGVAYGTAGLSALLLGGIAGGIVLKKQGLKRWLWPMAIIVNVPMWVYVIMSYTQPPVFIAAPLIFLEQFCYGFGFTAFTVYLMFAAQGRYKTSHFAISTGIMALGLMLPGMVSGYLQEALGYRHYFILTGLAGIPGLVTLLFLPIPEEEHS